MVRGFMSVILIFISNMIVPRWAFVGALSGLLSRTNCQAFANTAIIWLLPVLCSVYMHEDCFKGWMAWWTPCEEQYFDRSITMVFQIGSWMFNVPVYTRFSNSEVCGSSPRGGRCARGVVRIVGPLYVQKMLLQALTPLFTLAKCVAKKAWRQWAETGAGAIEERRSEAEQQRVDIISRDFIANLELAIVLGPSIPMLVPLCAMAMLTSHTITSVAASKFDLEIADGFDPQVWALLIASSFAQVLVTGLVYFDSALHGSWLVAAGLAATPMLWWQPPCLRRWADGLGRKSRVAASLTEQLMPP